MLISLILSPSAALATRFIFAFSSHIRKDIDDRRFLCNQHAVRKALTASKLNSSQVNASVRSRLVIIRGGARSSAVHKSSLARFDEVCGEVISCGGAR